MPAPDPPQRTAISPRVHRQPIDLREEPIDLLVRLRDRPYLVGLLGRWHARCPIITWNPAKVADESEDPFMLVDDVPDTHTTEDAFGGGWLGAWGYQLGGALEALGPAPARPVPQPLHRLAFYDLVLVLREGRWWLEQLIGLHEESEERDRRTRFIEDLASACGEPRPYRLGSFRPIPGEQDHVGAVQRTQKAIRAGDLFQANVTMRLEADLNGGAIDLFARGVRRLRPEFAAFLGWPDGQIASFSPELFLRRYGRQVMTSPIKGTAPATSDPGVLATSAKDRAENVMIVDLMRNDLARICRPGSVEVPALNRIEAHSVQHLVSDVSGLLDEGVTDGDLLRATFPPGSVTGAPKVAAMRLCNEVETTAREAYTGAIGYVSPVAGCELSVTIRTFEIAAARIWLGVGGGITMLSDPGAELEECFVKAAPLMTAVGGTVERGAAREPEVANAGTPLNPPLRSRWRPALPDWPPNMERPRVLIIDNYDSFVHNLAHYVKQAGASAWVVRNDAMTMEQVMTLRRRGLVTHVLISPGPGAPADAGIIVPLITALAPTTPVLGVCLGHQAIAEAFGGKVVLARTAVHGRPDRLRHDGRGVLARMPQDVTVARYHSLAVDPTSLPRWLEPTSWCEDGELMGVRHRLYSHVEGVQWHPESILTNRGQDVIRSFITTRAGAAGIRHRAPDGKSA
ncbi:chorismate-binding protein [Microbispora sp. H10836]|uniref:chorismate-binding protein n=1 Tax=Microbispora sp. H10836 TaxID=2729106 RepID=UPI00147570D4|nr:chorismate-binding protein [Microbispora sp. H10836]